MKTIGQPAPYILGCEQLPIPAAEFYEQAFATHILQKISAGFPSPAQDFEEDELDLNKYLAQRASCTFFFTAAGDSMKNAGKGIEHKQTNQGVAEYAQQWLCIQAGAPFP